MVGQGTMGLAAANENGNHGYVTRLRVVGIIITIIIIIIIRRASI